MNKYFNFIFYYILILIGLFVSSWIIWARFIRERTIREIPDYLFTEYRFWILLYICCIYLYVIKNLIYTKESSTFVKEIIELVFTPLKTLDYAIKYNKYVKPYYYKVITKFTVFASIGRMHFYKVHIFIFFMQIFPRIILVTFLLIDTFYFHSLL